MAPVTITRTHWIDDDGTGTTGTIINDAAKQEIYGQIDAALAQIGTWTDIPYAAGNFTANVGSWTVESGDVNTLAYSVTNKILILSFYLSATSVAGSPTVLSIALPAGIVTARLQSIPFTLSDNGVITNAYARAQVGGTTINLYRGDGSAFTTATNATYLFGTVSVFLQ